MRVLPERIYLHELDPNPPGPDTDYRTRWTVPLGVRESDLSVAYNPMHTTPHLLIFGAPKSGKTRIAHAVAQAICARNSPTQVRFMLADYRSGLLDAVPESHLLDAGAVNRNNATLEEAIKALAINLQKRLPPPDLTTAQLRARSWWTGPDVVLLVDDWHMIVAASGVMPPMAPLAPLLPAAADIGLHIIVTCQMSQAHRATMDKFVGAAYGAGSPTMFLSGEKTDFPSSEIKRASGGLLARHFSSRRTARRSSRRPTWIHRKKKCSEHPSDGRLDIDRRRSATLRQLRQQRDRGIDSSADAAIVC